MITTKLFILILIIIFIASLLQAALGFGFAIITMAFLPLILDYSRALALTQAIGIVSTSYIAIRYRRKTRWDVLAPFLVASLIVGFFFTAFSVKAPGDVLFVMLGVVLIILAVYFLIFSDKIHITPNKKIGVTMGSVCGVCNGLFALSGPPAALYMLPSIEDKMAYLATIQTYFTIVNIEGLIIRAVLGTMHVTDLPLVGAGWGLMLLGAFAGVRIMGYIKTDLFKKLVYILIGVNGLWIVASRLIR